MAAVPPSHASQLRQAPAFPPTPHPHQQLLNFPVTQERDVQVKAAEPVWDSQPLAQAGCLVGPSWGISGSLAQLDKGCRGESSS